MKTKQINIRLTPQEVAYLRKLALKEQLTISAKIRDLIKTFLKREGAYK